MLIPELEEFLIRSGLASRMETMDEINELLARCYAAIVKDGAKYPEDQFSIAQGSSEPPFVWWIGYRNSGDWKDNVQGPTLVGALRAWLDEYEHRYPIRYE